MLTSVKLQADPGMCPHIPGIIIRDLRINIMIFLPFSKLIS